MNSEDAEHPKSGISETFLYLDVFAFQMLAGVTSLAVPIYANMLRASPFLVGIIGSTGGLIYSFMPLISGMLSDRFGRKRFVYLSLLSFGLSCILYSLTKDSIILIMVRGLESLSAAIFWPSVEALIADLHSERLEETLRKFNISWSLAMLLGPLIGGMLIERFSILSPFIFSTVLSIPLGILSLIFIMEQKKEHERASFNMMLKREMRSANLAFASIILFSTTVGIITCLFPYHATDLNFPPYEIGFITFSFGAARVLTFLKATRIEAKIGKNGMFLLGSLSLATASLITSQASTPQSFTFCFIVYGFGAGLSYAASISSLFRLWSQSKAYAAGIFESLIGLGYVIGPLIGGTLSESARNAPYLFSFTLSFLVLLLQTALCKRSE
ncbi:MAG: MFS transporter [Nitrososphaerota archaeon]|nr:MFS transporter [Nitrososphaerota archaeon]